MINSFVVLNLVEYFCGFYYLIFGLNGFFKKIPLPPPSEKALEFLIAIEKAQFILPAVKIIEIYAGLCFIFKWQQPLAWALLSPVVFVILGYQFFLNKKEVFMPLMILSMHLILGYKYFDVVIRILLPQ